jgi:hypothetical protein
MRHREVEMRFRTEAIGHTTLQHGAMAADTPAIC